ncbi:MAG TPA: hypothetical protein VFH43_06820 [Candidatus Kapabacteria bacterium]|nr:hypothetical protein [Candidatus Kapabacteria bacterium]
MKTIFDRSTIAIPEFPRTIAGPLRTVSGTLRTIAGTLLLVFFCFIPGASATTIVDSARSADGYQNSDGSTQKASEPSPIRKNKLQFPNGKVLVSLPKGLRVFSEADFKKHYGPDAKPEYAFVDDSTESRYTVSVLKSKLAPNELEAYRVRMEKSLAKSVKDLIWFKREMLKFGETEWAHLEMQNQTSDGSTVMSDFYVTSMGGQPLVFTVMTNTKYWYEMRKVMQKMMLSVTVHEQPATSTK